MPHYTTKDYLKHKVGTQSKIEGRLQIGFVRCLKCRQMFGIYEGEVDNDGNARQAFSHHCGFKGYIDLEDWKNA